MDDDFNTSGGMAAMFELVRAINTARDKGLTGPFFEAAQRTLHELGAILGMKLEGARAESGVDVAAAPFIDLLVEVRGDLRMAKQWAAADKIRNQLNALGIVIEDTPTGAEWRYEEPAA